MDNSTNTSTERATLQSGYDLPLYGIDNGMFNYLHFSALFCIFCSLCCVAVTLTMSFRQRNFRKFFSWTKSERLAVYLAICDGGFNIFHSMDHLHYVITRDHVRPKELCEFYGFLLLQFILSQHLMVNVVAINTLTIMVFKKNINFGTRDWRLLTWTFGLPFASIMYVAVTGQLGPNGSFCSFDAVKGRPTNLFFTTIPLLLILLMNIVIYVVTWKRIRQETISLQQTLHTQSVTKRSQRVAKNMSMFVVAFFVQWGPLAPFGIWSLTETKIPAALFHTVTALSNIGGCLNLCVYILIRRRSLSDRRKSNALKQLSIIKIANIKKAESTPNEKT